MSRVRGTATADAERVDGSGVRAPLRLLICGARGSGKSSLLDRLFGSLRSANAQVEAGKKVDDRSDVISHRSFLADEISDGKDPARELAALASQVLLAVLLVDARHGFNEQTRRHALIASLIGVRHLVLAVNKIDLVGFERAVFDGASESFRDFVRDLGFKQIFCIPVCSREGDNFFSKSERTPWYAGPPLLACLKMIDVEDDHASRSFRMAVQSADPGTNSCTGTIDSGRLRTGDDIVVMPAGRVVAVKSLNGGNIDDAEVGETVTTAFTEMIDIAPGDMLSSLRDRPQVADQFTAHLLWLSNVPLLPERSYLMKINNNTVAATVTALKHRIDVDTLAKLAAKTLALNDIGVCNFATARPVVFDSFADNRRTGTFILIDRYSNETVAAGMIDFALRRATNIHLQNITISKAARSSLMRHNPAVLWFTGLSGAGKSTIANLVEAALHARDVHTLLLDGDNIRHGLNRDLGFTEVDRVENIRRLGEVAKLMTDAGLIVLCSFISPFKAERRMVRELVEAGEFVEIFVDTPLEECIARDPKGLYKRALSGEIKNFTGIDQHYEVPENPELRLEAGRKDAATLAQEVIEQLARRKIL